MSRGATAPQPPPLALVAHAATARGPARVARPPAPRPGRARRVCGHLAVIACFALPAVALWWHAWDGHLATTLTCDCGDVGQTVWFVAWPAYAMAHGIDPFFSNVVQVPAGINLLSNASSLPVGVLLAPITWTLGPIVTTNIALTLCPALSAWACWVACRHFTTWRWAPWVAGGLFGYSPFVVTNLAIGHIGLSLLVCPPLLVVAGHEVLFGTSGRRVRWGLALGGLVLLQFFISSEVLAIVTVVGVPVGVLSAVVGARAGRLAPGAELARALGATGALTALVLVGPVLAFLAGPQHLRGPLWAGAPVAGNPLDALWSAGDYRAIVSTLVRLGGYLGRQGPPSAYLGPVVLAATVLSLAVAWRRRSAWLLALCAALAAWCSLGALLSLSARHVDGVWLPWRLVGSLPILDDIIPQRFSAVVDLCVALVVGIGVDRARRLLDDARARRVDRRHARTPLPGTPLPGTPLPGMRRALAVLLGTLGLLAAASPWPTYQVPFATSTLAVPRWFTIRAPEIPANAVVLSVPFPFPTDGVSSPMVWQATDGMRFRLAGAYAKVPGRTGHPVTVRAAPLVDKVLVAFSAAARGPLPRGTPRQLAAIRTAMGNWRVDDVVVTKGARDARRAVAILRAAIGRPPHHRFGAWVWTMHPPPIGPTGAEPSP